MRNLVIEPNEINPADQFGEEPVNHSGICISEGWKTSFNLDIVHNGFTIGVQIEYYELEVMYFLHKGEKCFLDKEDSYSHVPKIFMIVGSQKTEIKYSALSPETRRFVLEACEYHMMNNQTFYKEEKEV